MPLRRINRLRPKGNFVAFPNVEKYGIPEGSPLSRETKVIPFEDLAHRKLDEKISTHRHNFENGLLTIFNFKKGAFVPTHQHDSDQVTHILSGKVKIVQGSDKEEFIFGKGDSFVLPAFIYHYLEALEDSEMIAVNPSTIDGKSKNFHH